MLSIKSAAGDPDALARWSALGSRALDCEAQLEDEGKEPLLITFPSPVSRLIASALRAAGFRFNKLLTHWEGRAHFDQAAILAVSYGGAITRVAASETGKDPRDDLAAAAE